MANNREISSEELLHVFQNAMPNAGISYLDIASCMSKFSQVSTSLYKLFDHPLIDCMYATLCEAVIENNRPIVQKILATRPELLLIEPPKKLVIESKLTWQKFYAEHPLKMAAKRHQFEMMHMLCGGYGNLKPELMTDHVIATMNEALSCWSAYEIQNNDGKDTIVIPQEYTNYAKKLIDVFCKETFPNGKPKYGDENKKLLEHVVLSPESEEVLQELFDWILPSEAAYLSSYPDVELLLLALLEAFTENFHSFKDWEQRNMFCIRAIGLVMTVLSPEVARIFCHGLVKTSKKGVQVKIFENAMKLLLESDEGFYRSSLKSRSGAGFLFYVGIHSHCARACAIAQRLLGVTNMHDFLCKIILDKNKKFLENNAVMPLQQVNFLQVMSRAV